MTRPGVSAKIDEARAKIIRRCGPMVIWPEYKIIDAAQKWAELNGAPPKVENWRPAGEFYPNAYTVRVRFGSWAEMLRAAGFQPRKNGCPAYWTRERIIEAIQRFNAENGRPPQVREMVAGANQPHFTTVRAMFGSHRAALEAAGLECPPAGRAIHWTRERIADEMLNHLFRTGAWPTTREWSARRQPGETRPSHGIVRARFGSWNAAKRFAGWAPEKEGAPPWSCAGCGTTDRDNRTLGCRSCADRIKRRKLRKTGPASSSADGRPARGAAPFGKPSERHKRELVTSRSDGRSVPK